MFREVFRKAVREVFREWWEKCSEKRRGTFWRWANCESTKRNAMQVNGMGRSSEKFDQVSRIGKKVGRMDLESWALCATGRCSIERRYSDQKVRANWSDWTESKESPRKIVNFVIFYALCDSINLKMIAWVLTILLIVSASTHWHQYWPEENCTNNSITMTAIFTKTTWYFPVVKMETCLFFWHCGGLWAGNWIYLIILFPTNRRTSDQCLNISLTIELCTHWNNVVGNRYWKNV